MSNISKEYLARIRTYVLSTKDSYGVLSPGMISFDAYPSLKAKLENAVAAHTIVNLKNLAFANYSRVYVRMLQEFEDEVPKMYRDVAMKLFGQPGKDIDTFKGVLLRRELVKLDHVGKHNSKWYVITAAGKEVLKIAEANNTMLKILRWFKCKDIDQLYLKMVEHALETGEDSHEDLEPKSIVNACKELLVDGSAIDKAGSRHRWMNSFISAMKTYHELFEKVDILEVHEFLRSNYNSAAKRFTEIMTSTRHKWSKKLNRQPA